MELKEAWEKLRIGKIDRNGSFDTLGKIGVTDLTDTLSFLSNKEFLNQINNKISCVITNSETVKDLLETGYKGGIWITDNPKTLFYQLHEYLVSIGFYEEKFDSKIDHSSKISSSAVVASKNVIIGKNTIIEEHAVIKENTVIGDNCVIHSGVIIGTPGYEICELNGIKKVVTHVGKVIIGDNVEIQANSAISKGLFPSRNTIINNEVTTDNLVHIAHGVQIGERTEIAANAMIAGNVTIGKNVWIGPSSVISNSIQIGDNALITLGAVVTKNVESGQRVSGNFAIDHRKFIQFIKTIR